MIYKEHYIELFVNGFKCDIESQKSLNLRFNNVIYDPEKISSTQADYSFEFELPSTPTNDVIFDYANNLAKVNKFHKRWNAEVYADGTIIFRGSLTLNGFKDKMYKCNLVNIKTYSLEDIFGDSVLTDVDWKIPFDGAGTSGKTINYYNELGDYDVTFPLVCYGAFQKSPSVIDEVENEYTSKFLLDQWNRWYVESFAPSLNMVEYIKKAFQSKGYTASGDIFEDEILKNIFMSCNLADGQAPDYNLGNPKFGKIELSVNWTNPMDTVAESGSTKYGLSQDLNFPYFSIKGNIKYGSDPDNLQEAKDKTGIASDYNFDAIRTYDMLSSGDGGTVSVAAPSYMYQPNEHLIVIPSDGFYRINMTYSGSLNDSSNITVGQQVYETGPFTGITLNYKNISIKPDLAVTCPLEIQLVRNYEDNIELIKGKDNLILADGNPNNLQPLGLPITNRLQWPTCFPHEKLGSNPVLCPCPTSRDGMITPKKEQDISIGYIYGDNTTMAYDPAVNSDFILGCTTMGNYIHAGAASVIKNGYSWSKQVSERHYSFYKQQGYYKVNASGSGFLDVNYTSASTKFNSNEYIDAPISYHNQTNNTFAGAVYATVYLKKNDILQLFAVHRDYQTAGDYNPVSYQTTASVNLSIEAVSPNTQAHLVQKGYNYNTPTEYDVDLRVTNFLNKEKKTSEWMQNIFDAFNIEMTQEGKSVFLNKRRKINRNMNYAVGIDNRCNSSDAEASMINYPKSMAIKYKIDTDEWGFERSAVEKNGGDESILNDDDWMKYGESGYTVIELNDDSYVTTKSEKNLQFSYTWYDNFTWLPVNSDFEETGDAGEALTLRLPVISKYSYMIDGYDYEESMKHDGYGLAQRFWFRPQLAEEYGANAYVWTRTYPVERVDIYIPSNEKDKLNLSYKATENSLLNNYFNITPFLGSNYVKVDVYLTPEEYKSIKNGCMVRFDSDLYYPVEISGYDASGSNPTELKMMKKIN